MISKISARAGGVSFCILFVLLGAPWIDKPGIQTDEALFAGGIYPPFNEPYVTHIRGSEIPIMASTVNPLSVNPPARIADKYPKTIPKNMHRTAAPMITEKVAGIPALIWSTTLSELE